MKVWFQIKQQHKNARWDTETQALNSRRNHSKKLCYHTHIHLLSYTQSAWKFQPKTHWQKKLLNCLNFTFNTLTALTKCLYGFSLTDTSEDYGQILSPNSNYHLSSFSCRIYQQIPFFCFSSWSSQLPAVLCKLPSTFPRKRITCRAAQRGELAQMQNNSQLTQVKSLHCIRRLSYVLTVFIHHWKTTLCSYNPGKYWAFK